MNRKLILFDIDGTLILTRGVAVKIMVEAVTKVLGHPIQWSIRDFVGNTDRNILMTLLIGNGATQPMLQDLVRESLDIYLNNLKEGLKRDSMIHILPGVKQLLEKLKTDSRFALGLLTGNVREGARIKLSKDNLYDYFPIGAFGDDALNRDKLPSFAIQRAEKYYRHFFDRKDTWIVGDSINDIKCARANHLKCLAVTTGRIKEDELAKYHPTKIIPDLSNTKEMLSIFLS